MEHGTHPLWPLLVSYRDSYNQRVNLIRDNFSDLDKKDGLFGWIEQAYHYADLTYQTGLRIVGTGGKLSRIDQQGRTIKRGLDGSDLFELYSERLGQIRNLERHVRPFDAIPIFPGTLRSHENRGKGLLEDRHVLAKHVPKFVQDLHQRLEEEPDRRVVSGFLSREIAESALARTIVRNEEGIQTWLRGDSRSRGFTTDFGSEAIGLVLRRYERTAFNGHKVTIVLVRDKDSPAGYWIKTSKIYS